MAGNREITDQLRRIERCFWLLDLPMCRQPPASPAEIDELQSATGIRISDGLREMWLYSNGSDVQPWFICDPDENRELMEEILPDGLSDAGFYLHSTARSLEQWAQFKGVDEDNPEGWIYDAADNPYRPKLDRRVATQLLRHRLRLKFGGEMWGGSGELQIDAGPSPLGNYGQVVQYVHDPDNLLYVAPSFEIFLDQSLRCMEQWIKRDPEHARELFEDPKTKQW